MNLYCIEEFKAAVEKLIKNNSYATLEQEIINHFFNKPTKDVIEGTRLNGSANDPFIKKRIGGSGGFRTYFYVKLQKDNLYLLYTHPKTGPLGRSNVPNPERNNYLKKLIEVLTKEGNLYQVTKDTAGKKLSFEKVEKETTVEVAPKSKKKKR